MFNLKYSCFSLCGLTHTCSLQDHIAGRDMTLWVKRKLGSIDTAR